MDVYEKRFEWARPTVVSDLTTLLDARGIEYATTTGKDRSKELSFF